MNKKLKVIIPILIMFSFILVLVGCRTNAAIPPDQGDAEFDGLRSSVGDAYRLYFADPAHSSLMTEERQFSRVYGENGEESLARAREALDALIVGPSDMNNRATVNNASKINSMRHEDDDILHIDFDDGFISEYEQLGTNPQMTINSIVATLTQFDPIRGVRMTVNNEPLVLNDVIYKDPIFMDDTATNKHLQ